MRNALTGASGGITFIIMYSVYGVAFWWTLHNHPGPNLPVQVWAEADFWRPGESSNSRVSASGQEMREVPLFHPYLHKRLLDPINFLSFSIFKEIQPRDIGGGLLQSSNGWIPDRSFTRRFHSSTHLLLARPNGSLHWGSGLRTWGGLQYLWRHRWGTGVEGWSDEEEDPLLPTLWHYCRAVATNQLWLREGDATSKSVDGCNATSCIRFILSTSLSYLGERGWQHSRPGSLLLLPYPQDCADPDRPEFWGSAPTPTSSSFLTRWGRDRRWPLWDHLAVESPLSCSSYRCPVLHSPVHHLIAEKLCPALLRPRLRIHRTGW